MGITRGQLKKLGFKQDKYKNLLYEVTKQSSLILPKGKTVIFHELVIASESEHTARIIPIVHLDETGFEEMLNFLMNLKNSSMFKLKNQIEDF